MGQTRLKQILKDSQFDFTSLFKITNLANGTASNDAVNFGQLKSVVDTINGLEWQNSALDYVTDNTAVPATEVLGDRYILSTTGGTPNAAWDGAVIGSIVQFNGTIWIATSPTTGMFISADNENTLLYYWGGSAWTTKEFESTTASTGLTKVGFDIRLDASAAGNGIGFSAGVLSLNLSELTGAVIDVSADSIAFLDVTDSSTKLESVSDFVNIIAGTVTTSGLSATSGVLSLNINGLTTDTALAGTEVFAMFDGANKKITWTNMLTAIDTSIFTAANFVDGTTIDFTVTSGASVTASVKTESLTAAYLNDVNVPTAGQVLSATTSVSGTTFTWVDNGIAGTPKRVRAAAHAVASGEGVAITDVFGSDDPSADIIPMVFVNGIAVFIGDVGDEATADCWFAESGVNGTAVSFANINGNENLVWDVVNANYALDTNDTIEVRYTV